MSLVTIAREWARLGCIGFGGPPTHIALLRRMCVEERRWIDATDFEDGIAATNLLPGPASTQLAIFCAWRLRGTAGAVLGGICFIVPGLVLILALSAVFLAGHPPTWVLGAAAGAGAAVPAVALHAATGLVPASRRRIGTKQDRSSAGSAYVLVGAVSAATVGPFLVLVLVSCGVVEIVVRRKPRPTSPGALRAFAPGAVVHVAAAGGLLGLAWVAFKVGALSYGGGFVIIPLMQHDAVTTYHWMTAAQFLNAVAFGQITPGPVVQTVAVVGYAAAGVGGGSSWPPSSPSPRRSSSSWSEDHGSTGCGPTSTVQSFLTGCRPGCRRSHRRIGHPPRSFLPASLADPAAGRRRPLDVRPPAWRGRDPAHRRNGRCGAGPPRSPRLTAAVHCGHQESNSLGDALPGLPPFVPHEE